MLHCSSIFPFQEAVESCFLRPVVAPQLIVGSIIEKLWCKETKVAVADQEIYLTHSEELQVKNKRLSADQFACFLHSYKTRGFDPAGLTRWYAGQKQSALDVVLLNKKILVRSLDAGSKNLASDLASGHQTQESQILTLDLRAINLVVMPDSSA
ncbi:hypothetical protein NC653_014445 [Populus alba x Populus x berolinensis]|uniref:Uncharacterized protein n=1 Tax=Populus alba x Populus x berolinensis TaxID=444605 RepID=A0AAD6QX93_9ROSI|nr:hypothetical protein NC653_014445 [Populus alba x Populus x berolinensis]